MSEESGDGSAFARAFAQETWALYSVGISIVVLRYIARIRRFGIKLKADDWVMANGVVWYTILCIAFNRVASGGGSNFMTDEDIAALTPEIKHNRTIGSKWVFVSEHAMILSIWSSKICMLILYASITEGLKQRKWVNYVAIYTALSFLGSEMALWLICRPLTEYWAVPVENSQCSTYQYFEIINGCLSIPGDMAILAIGIPILANLRMPIQQKAVLLVIFGMGGFIIVAAILTKVYCLVPRLISYLYMNWYFREASVAVYVTNLPAVWPLIREIFPSLQTLGSRTKVTGNSGTHAWANPENHSRFGGKEDYDLKTYKKGPRAESQECINDSDFFEAHSDPHTISVQREVSFTVENQAAPGSGTGQQNWEKQKITTVINTVN